MINKLISVFCGLFWIVVGFMFWLSLVGNPIHELALIKRGVVTNGVITDTWEDTGKADDGRLRGFVQSMKAVKANLQIEGRQLSW